MGDSKFNGILRYLTVEYNTPDLSTWTVTPYIDFATTPDISIVPTAVGFNRTHIPIQNSTYTGRYISLLFAYDHDLTSATRSFTLYEARGGYDLINRIS